MARKQDSKIVKAVHPFCCGLDVHKGSISACFLTVNKSGDEDVEVKEYGTFSDDLEVLRVDLLHGTYML